MQKKLLVILISSAFGLNATWADSADNADELNNPQKAPDDLGDIIVTATRSEIDIEDAPGSVTVINHEEIKQKGGNNILDIVRGTPGISLQGIGSGGRKALSLRGMESKHTLILVNGKRLPASNDVIGPNTDYQYDWIPTGRIERIEVVRGPMSVLYGADALAGVINIITRKPTDKLEADIKLTGRLANGDSANDRDGHDIEFNLSGSIRPTLQFSMGGQQGRRASVSSKLKPGQSVIEGREKQQLSLELNWQPADQHNITLEYSNGQEDRWLDTATRLNLPYKSTYDIDRQQLSLGWKGSIGQTLSSLRAYRSNVEITNHTTNGVTPTVPQELQETIMEGTINFPVGLKQTITAGLEHRIEALENPNLTGGKDDFTLNSLYLQDEVDLTERTLITLGARIDDHEAFGSEVSPRASIVWNATDQWIFKGSYGHGFRAPTIKQVSPGYSFPLGIFVIASNPDLKPETNNALELGTHYSSEKYRIDAAVFDNKVKNLIDTRFDTFLPGGVRQQWTYDNIDEAHLKGAEFSTEVQLSNALKLTANYQYLDAKDSGGERLERRPRHTLSTGLSWQKNDWKVHLNAERLADQIIDFRVGRNLVPTEVPDYTLWNVGVRNTISKHIELAASIENLTDVRLEEESPVFRHEEYPRTLKLELRGSF